ncbi:30S ribosomal protein S13 [candidate division KSB1 bacterium]|nr:30S ribosomal protein S13 [candidate division KSB1 bacterium]TDI97819.1 MAG: 30S ribosomal protein S13 [Caldithrix sp.]
MARISGVDLPRDKRVEIGLTYIYGIGLSSSQKILNQAQVDGGIRVKDLSTEDVTKIRNIVTKDFKVEGALRTDININIKRLMDIGCYRGLRHRRKLPSRGQRTHTNARTRRGRRGATVGGKKK